MPVVNGSDCRRGRAAFTLIELLIVVAIIAIPTALAVPGFLEAQTRSTVARVKAYMRTLTTTIRAFHSGPNHHPVGTDNAPLVLQRTADHFSRSTVAPGASGATPTSPRCTPQLARAGGW